ncbi:MAG: DUF3800 domain-containing protein [Rhizobiales bacterium]|nr:DUF3800 domain-containing protein [Hyphomicrobiales bacterium]
MVLAECYLDETQTSGERSVFAVAGLVFRNKEAAIRQAVEWSVLLGKWSLPYFHMTDCALGQGVFKNLSDTDKDTAAREAIAIIRATASAYIYVTVEVSRLAEDASILSFLGGPYEWCAISVLPSVAGWCEKNPDVKEVAYFFESGAKGQANASYRIAEMLEVDDFKAQCRYSGMSFVEKVKSAGAQAADIIAWHAGKDAKRAFAGEERRRDFAALIEGIPAYGGNWSAAMLRAIASEAASSASELELPVEKLAQIEQLARRQKPKSGRPQ